MKLRGCHFIFDNFYPGVSYLRMEGIRASMTILVKKEFFLKYERCESVGEKKWYEI